MRKVCEDFETELVEFNGERDHVHPLVHYPPKASVSKLVGSLNSLLIHHPICRSPLRHGRTPSPARRSWEWHGRPRLLRVLLPVTMLPP